jgi:hypothetical protein
MLVTRRLLLEGRRVWVRIDRPRPLPTVGPGYFCTVLIEGLHPTPVRRCVDGTEPAQALTAGLSVVCEHLHMSVEEFLSYADIGGPGVGDAAPPP